jgi:hypothetical protein
MQFHSTTKTIRLAMVAVAVLGAATVRQDWEAPRPQKSRKSQALPPSTLMGG